jgi:orotate phosphoribosyltransferase
MENIVELINRHEVRHVGHFVSGVYHTRVHYDTDEIFTDPVLVGVLGIELGMPFRFAGVQAVVGLANGGIALAGATAKFFSLDLGENKPPVRAVFLDKDRRRHGRFTLRPSFRRFVESKKVLIVDNFIGGGDSLNAAAEELHRCGAEIIGAAAMASRTPKRKLRVDVPKVHILTSIAEFTWARRDCPLCPKGIPINTRFADGKAYVKKYGQPKPRRSA